MDIARRLETIIGGIWNGISFYSDKPECPEGVMKLDGVRFCEALVETKIHKVLLDPKKGACPGARYAFGCMGDGLQEMIRRFVEKGYPADYAEVMINEIPHLHSMPAAIGLNTDDSPHVLVSALQPKQAMQLVQLYQKKLKKSFQTTVPSVISICGNVAVKALKTGEMTLSFGCEDSREFGGISRDRLIVGLPYELGARLT